MTIMDLVNKKEQIDRMSKRIRDTIAKTGKGFESINKFEKSTDEDGKKAINLARISTNELIMDLNECQKQLREYSLLLDSVLRQTIITWPPKCTALE